VHEAFKLTRRQRRELPFDAVLDDREEALGSAWSPRTPVEATTPEEVLEQRERLAYIRQLPERQQRLVWLHAAGLTYAEIAVHEQCTVRTVERQLLRGKHRLCRASHV